MLNSPPQSMLLVQVRAHWGLGPAPRSWGEGWGGKERDFPTGSVAAVVKLAGRLSKSCLSCIGCAATRLIVFCVSVSSRWRS